MPVDTETDVEKVEIVRDEQDNVQRPANTAEQQATQGAIDAAKNELLTKLDTVGADPIEVRGSPVNVVLLSDESVTVPAGKAWKVTVTVTGNVNAGGKAIKNGNLLIESKYGTNVGSIETQTWLFESDTIKSATSGSTDPTHILGWEVSI